MGDRESSIFGGDGEILTIVRSSKGPTRSPHTMNALKSIPFDRKRHAIANQSAALVHSRRAQHSMPTEYISDSRTDETDMLCTAI